MWRAPLSLASVLLLLPLLFALGCGTDRRRVTADGSVAPDTSVALDSGMAEDGSFDSGAPMDSGTVSVDSGVDTGTRVDSATPDTGVRDSGVRDTGIRDSGTPDTGRPDTGPPPVTIEDIQRGTVLAGEAVILSDMSVTGIYDLGAWVQDPALGPAYSGIRIYVGVRPAVAIGDRVDIEGSVLDYFGDTEIEATTFVRIGAGTPLSAVPVTVAQAVSEPYEGVLVRITDATSSLPYYDCTIDNPACSDTDVWQVSSGVASVLVHDFVYEDVDWLTQIGDRRITGIMSYRYDSRRILPRRSIDLQP